MTKAFYSKKNQDAWNSAYKKNEALLIGYLIAEDPTASKSLEMLKESVVAGIDIIEMGIPSGNPYMDGAIIKRGHQRVTSNEHYSEESLIAYWTLVRQQIEIPIWAMGYKADLVDTGLCMRLAQLGLIDGLVLPDCSLAESDEIDVSMREYGVDVVRFASTGMTDDELMEMSKEAKIVYAQSYSGATGNPLAQLGDLSELYHRIRKYTSALTISGFGLRTPEKVRLAIESGFEGAVVGSVLVARCENGEQDYLYRLIADMKIQTDLGIGKE
ncbi:tryptophan synthase subunit alpha [Paenibacillus eucommiae]|uniref:tryptophan synthase n=1 Tax=Paenibacillus eucommiae TaxID=1355755 RepID=A0ABS4J2Y2_9BACL|nr:tryptophan synthase subunit alpha [Paenibacillus eucommiae]MBP1994190.1 tryptophan synthase alpha chain [Paenibacillus eucommiae]